MGRNRIKGGCQREKEREGEREVGEGLRAREEGSREERAEGERKHKQRYCATVRQEAASAENRPPKERANDHLHVHKSKSNIIYKTFCSFGG